jgi:hypothetical protein
LIFTVSMLTVQIINNHLKLSLYLTQYKWWISEQK